ncbi:MAG: phosphatidylinositol-specific phospholipase C1-like protein [Pseudomonadota bacterium]
MNRETRVTAFAAACMALVACSDGSDRPPLSPIAMNEVQYLGTHNSYKRPIRPDLFEILRSVDPTLADSLDYSHLPLQEQFTNQGIRQIELDVFYDPEGGLYASRQALVLVGEDPESKLPELDEAGLKVLHIQEIDYETNCLSLVECLRAVKSWSDANPGHLPIMILVEAKDAPIDDPLDLGFVVPLPFDARALDSIDQEILSVFSTEQLITPDWVRGERPSLEETILTVGWPRLDDARGRIMFALDNGGTTRDLYIEGHPSLAGRVLFTDSEPGTPEAAFIKQNSPDDFQTIQAWVRQGYMVRTRADAGTEQARTGDTTRRDTALLSGAHFISTDYPVPDQRFTDYKVEIPGDNIARCNPVNASADCIDSEL